MMKALYFYTGLIALCLYSNSEASFQKNKTTKFGVVGNYHTITNANLNFLNLPILTFNNLGDITSVKGGSKSTIVMSIYKDKAAYDARAAALEQKIYEVDFMTAIGVVRNTSRTCEQAAYDLVKSMDSFYLDATVVP